MLPAAPRSTAAAARICRATLRLCVLLGWAPLREVRLPNGRRADILALRPNGGFACIEVKSCARDFLSDTKWPDYRDVSDALYFAVAPDFPRALLPREAGLILAADEAELVREPEAAPRLSAALRRQMTQRFARLAAMRLLSCEDPAATDLRGALRAD